MLNSASFIFSFRWVSAKAKKKGFSNEQSSLKNGIFLCWAFFEINPSIFATLNFSKCLSASNTDNSSFDVSDVGSVVEFKDSLFSKLLPLIFC